MATLDRLKALAARINPAAALLQEINAATGLHYGQEVNQGRFRIVTAVYGPHGRSTVTPQSDWMPQADLVPALTAIRDRVAC